MWLGGWLPEDDDDPERPAGHPTKSTTMSSSSSPSCGDGGPYTLCVIGASGFVGSHVTQQALEKGWKVIKKGLNCLVNSKFEGGAQTSP